MCVWTRPYHWAGAIVFHVHIWTPKTIIAVLLVAAAVVWFLVNDPVEGRTLLVVTPQHGLTEADLLSIAAVALAAVLVVTDRRGACQTRGNRQT